MTTYTVHHEARAPAEIIGNPDTVELVKESISWGALVFGPLWLLARGLWLAAAAYLFCITGVILALNSVDLPATLVWVFVLAGQLLLALEGNNLRRSKLHWLGKSALGLVVAPSLNEAERRFFSATIAALDSASTSPAKPSPVPVPGRNRVPALAQSTPVGFFPAPGGPQ